MTKHTQTLFRVALATAGLLSSAAVSYSQEPTDTRIIPAINLSPDIVEVGQASHVVITISSPNRGRKLLPGDTFTLDFDLDDGQILTFPTSVAVTNPTLSATDFLISQGISPSQLVIIYQGAPAELRLKDAITVEPELQAPSRLRVNRVRLQLPAEGWFGNVVTGVASWSMIDLRF